MPFASEPQVEIEVAGTAGSDGARTDRAIVADRTGCRERLSAFAGLGVLVHRTGVDIATERYLDATGHVDVDCVKRGRMQGVL